MGSWKYLTALLALAVASPGTARAQESLAARCQMDFVENVAQAGEACLSAVQAIVSAQPALGIVIAGGNPTIGSAGNAGMRIGMVPRVSAGIRLNVVGVRLPDLLAEQIDDDAGSAIRRYGVPAPSATGDISIGVFNGFSTAPGVGGIGGVSLLGSVSYLPFSLLTDGFDEADVSYGIGARIHILDESFGTPGVSLSVMRRQLPEVAFGDVCPGGIESVGGPSIENTQYGGCAGDGDVGEFSFDLTDWSTRLVASKRLLGIGATLGVGYDSYQSDIGFGFRGEEVISGTDLVPVFRVSDEVFESDRWAVFGNLSYTLLVVTLGLEAGWQQGTAPISGFDDLQGDFNPKDGTWFASLGMRLGL